MVILAGILWAFGSFRSAPTPPVPEEKACVITGCSGQICADKEVLTTCEYREEYACYGGATCERQASGACGWTLTPELISCLEGKGAVVEQ